MGPEGTRRLNLQPTRTLSELTADRVLSTIRNYLTREINVLFRLIQKVFVLVPPRSQLRVLMVAPIIGTLPLQPSVDSNGSLSLNVPIQLPPAKLTPGLSFAYHSAAGDTNVVGQGWVIKGIAQIERVPATLAQDGFRGKLGQISPKTNYLLIGHIRLCELRR